MCRNAMTTDAERYAPLDAALDALRDCAPDLSNGLSNHGPMAAEALCALGYSARVADWVSRYRRDGLPWPKASIALDAPDPAARGDASRATDWRQFFRRQLESAAWVDGLREAIAWLAPAASADATHGLIRVGHAARSLAIEATTARRHELADALAAWASGYSVLGGEPDMTVEGLSAAEAIVKVPLLPEPQRRFEGSITSGLAPLSAHAPFAPVLDLLRTDQATPDVAEVFARVYLANATDVLTTIVFIHGVTSITTIGHLLPCLSARETGRLLRFGWQASAALYAAFGRLPPVDSAAAPSTSMARLAKHAADHGDEHVIKFTEACLWNHARRPSSAFLAAAEHAQQMLPRPRR